MPTIWYDAVVRKIEEIAPNVRQFLVEIPELNHFDFRSGQFVTLDLPLGEKRLQRWRSYSIANGPRGSNQFELCVVQSEAGQGSKYLFESVTEGSVLRLKGPDGNFCLPEQPDKTLVMVCTGTGIAPFRSMLQDLLGAKGHQGPVHLIFGTRYESGLLYREEMEQFSRDFPNFRYDFALSRDEKSTGHKGYVHEIYLKEYGTAKPELHFYLCGWSNMIDDAVANLIIKCGYERGQVLYELYG